MVEALSTIFEDIKQRDDIRVAVLTGNGRSFCAGADLTYMRTAADYTFEENVLEGETLFNLMLAIDTCPKPVVGRINGSAIGGGVGLVSCCDIAVTMERAKFGFSEVRLGLVPAIISPFVLSKLEVRYARELILTGERFEAHYAAKVGLVNHVVSDEVALDEKVRERVEQLLLAAPGAQRAAKELIRTVAYQAKPTMRRFTAELIAKRRASEEGREGMGAFLAKRPPNWQRIEDS
jgi:methylglutaconyl-CoA hydratase